MPGSDGLLGMAVEAPDLSKCMRANDQEWSFFEVYRCPDKGIFYKLDGVTWDAPLFRFQLLIWLITIVSWLWFMFRITPHMRTLPSFYLQWISMAFVSLFAISFSLNFSYKLCSQFLGLGYETSVGVVVAIWSLFIGWIWFRISESHH